MCERERKREKFLSIHAFRTKLTQLRFPMSFIALTLSHYKQAHTPKHTHPHTYTHTATCTMPLRTKFWIYRDKTINYNTLVRLFDIYFCTTTFIVKTTVNVKYKDHLWDPLTPSVVNEIKADIHSNMLFVPLLITRWLHRCVHPCV